MKTDKFISFIFLAMVSCTSVVAMTGVFGTCARADLGQIVTSDGKILLTDIAFIIAANASTLEADLASVAAQVGMDAVLCAIAAVEAVEFNSGSGGSGSGVSNALPISNDGLTRAIQWANKNGGKL